jgi:queuine tRNA-ribosyltransferase
MCLHMARQKFEIVTTSLGITSIRNNEVNEIMHNPVGPWAEANHLYINQSELADKIRQNANDLTVFDVGLGAAANALAALSCFKNTPSTRRLKLISFERDLELLAFALENSHHFAHFNGFESALTSILRTGCFEGERYTWHLRHDDFTESLKSETHKANIIFYDPYSPNKNEDMWTSSLFSRLRAHCDESDCTLFTYSQATKVRTALICSGFYVGLGSAVGKKQTTTAAATQLTQLKSPLADEWYQTYLRSDNKYPTDAASDGARTVVDEMVKDYFLKVTRALAQNHQ